MLVSVHHLVINMSFDCCWFDCVTSEPASATVLLRTARVQITYQLLRGYQSTTHYGAGTRQLRPTMALVSVNYYYYSDTITRLQVNDQPLRGEQSTTNNCYQLLRSTTQRVHELLLCFNHEEFSSVHSFTNYDVPSMESTHSP